MSDATQDPATQPELGMDDAATADEPPRFETLLSELETVVARLERGDQSLEDALGDFERGTTLADRAGKILDAAQARVDQLLEARDGTTREEPFDAEQV